jgi:hypothetical protein
MNERIKQLAEQAGTYFGGGTTDYFGDYLPPYVSITDLDLEKFAELIVRDCMDVVDGYTKSRTFETHYDAVAQIEQLFGIKHFGVEE